MKALIHITREGNISGAKAPASLKLDKRPAVDVRQPRNISGAKAPASLKLKEVAEKLPV